MNFHVQIQRKDTCTCRWADMYMYRERIHVRVDGRHVQRKDTCTCRWVDRDVYSFHTCSIYRIAGNFSEVEIFANFAIRPLIAKIKSREILF